MIDWGLLIGWRWPCGCRVYSYCSVGLFSKSGGDYFWCAVVSSLFSSLEVTSRQRLARPGGGLLSSFAAGIQAVQVATLRVPSVSMSQLQQKGEIMVPEAVIREPNPVSSSLAHDTRRALIYRTVSTGTYRYRKYFYKKLTNDGTHWFASYQSQASEIRKFS